MQEIKAEVLILDDEEASLELSRRAISRYIPENAIYTAATVEAAMDILREKHIELAFLDVELRSSDGFTFCQYIHREYPAVTVVILTGHVDFGAKSYDYEPFDFLVKPVDTLRLERTLTRFTKRKKEESTSNLVISTNTGFAILNTEDILYVVKNGNLCHIHCVNGDIHRVAYTLDKLESMLDGKRFFRTYQSYLVSVTQIRQVRSTSFGTSFEAVLKDGSVVPVSRNKYAKLKEFILHQSVCL